MKLSKLDIMVALGAKGMSLGGGLNKDWILFFRYAEIKWRLKFRKKVRQSINLFSSSEPKAIMGGWKYT